MNTLIIWNEFSEGTKLYLIPDEVITNEQEQYLLKCVDCIINDNDSFENDGLKFLTNALCSDKESCFEGDPNLYCIYSKFKVTSQKLANGGVNITRVIYTGFMP